LSHPLCLENQKALFLKGLLMKKGWETVPPIITCFVPPLHKELLARNSAKCAGIKSGVRKDGPAQGRYVKRKKRPDPEGPGLPRG
jgi:hypothetical protein